MPHNIDIPVFSNEFVLQLDQAVYYDPFFIVCKIYFIFGSEHDDHPALQSFLLWKQYLVLDIARITRKATFKLLSLLFLYA